jgi:hypothetical protein
LESFTRFQIKQKRGPGSFTERNPFQGVRVQIGGGPIWDRIVPEKERAIVMDNNRKK